MTQDNILVSPILSACLKSGVQKTPASRPSDPGDTDTAFVNTTRSSGTESISISRTHVATLCGSHLSTFVLFVFFVVKSLKAQRPRPSPSPQASPKSLLPPNQPLTKTSLQKNT